MANVFQFTDWLTMEGLRLLVNKLQVAQFFNTSYNSQFTKDFAVGETVRVPLPQRFLIRDGLGYSPQAINRIYTTVAVNQIFGVDFEWDSVEQALKVERGEAMIRKNYLEPAMAQLAQEIDSRSALWAYQNANNIVGVLGTDPSSTSTFMAARQRLIELACPPSNEKGVIVPPSVNTALVPAVQSLFNPASDISRQYKEGSIGRLNGFDWYESMSLQSHTAGTFQGAVTVTTTSVSGATTLALTCTNGDIFNKGDVIGIASVYATNPMTRQTTTQAQTKQFVVTSASQTISGTSATISVSPTIYGPGSQYQNVSRLPTAGDVVTLFPGTASPNALVGKQGLAIHPDAFALVGVRLESPKATEITSQTRDPETGLALRFVRMFDPQQSKMINRFDVLIGYGNLYSDNCCVRIQCGA